MKNKTRLFATVAAISMIIFIIVAVLVWSFLIWSVKPDQSNEAVLIHKPMIRGMQGVDPTPVKTGRKYVWWTTDHIFVNMQPQQYEVHFDDLMSSDGVPLDFDAVMRIKVLSSVALIRDFGPEWYNNNVKSEFMNRVRQAVRVHGMNETAIDTNAIDQIDRDVSTAMDSYIRSIDIPIKLVDVTVGKANPPDSIKDQRVETAKEQQRALTEAQRKLAEDARMKAEQSRALADNAYRNAMGLSPEQFLRLEEIKMMKESCPNGHCSFILGDAKVSPIITK